MSKGIPETFIEELKQKTNIVNVISKYVPLEKKGKNYWGRCPFHLEKTPSFCINEVDQFYHCFGCKASGNAIKFVMEMESISFTDAIKLLAEWNGMQMPVIDGDDDYDKTKNERKEMVRCMRECAMHYHDNLKLSAVAREYLHNRKLSQEMINRFGIGYSLNYTEIIQYLTKKGFSRETIKNCGIIKEKDGRFYDAIGERIAFPVINIYGEVVAFSGRTMAKDVNYAKYLNTAETLLYSKSKNLFGINLVKKCKQENGLKEVIIVEGQIDVISLHQAGFNNAVASLGTALTVEQARIIKRLSDNVIICYDGDYAGTKATLRGLDILKQENLNVRVASLPDGKDPDEIIKDNGKGFFEKILQDALPLIEFKLKYLKNQFNLTEFDGKAKYIDEAMKVLQGLSEVESEVYLDYIKEICGVNKEFLRDKLRKDANLQLNSSNLIHATSTPKREEKHYELSRQAEICVLANILRQKEYATVSPNLNHIFSTDTKPIFDYLITLLPTVSEFIAKFEEQEVVGEIVNFIFSDDEINNQQQFTDCLWLLYKNKLIEKQADLMGRLSGATGEERTNIMKELMNITKQLNTRRIE